MFHKPAFDGINTNRPAWEWKAANDTGLDESVHRDVRSTVGIILKMCLLETFHKIFFFFPSAAPVYARGCWGWVRIWNINLRITVQPKIQLWPNGFWLQNSPSFGICRLHGWDISESSSLIGRTWTDASINRLHNFDQLSARSAPRRGEAHS